MKRIPSILILVALAGCSGGATTEMSSGSAIFRIEWPEQTRLIPKLADSIRIKVVDPENGAVLKNVVATRKGAFEYKEGSKTFSVVEIKGLPEKKLEDIVTAHVESGLSVALAEGRAFVEIKKDTPANVKISLVSTIESLERLPDNDVSLLVNQSIKLGITAKNKDRESVFFIQNDALWTVSDAKIASIKQDNEFIEEFRSLNYFQLVNGVFQWVPCTATITGLKPGVATVTATEPESGKKTSWKVTVGNNSEIITIK